MKEKNNNFRLRSRSRVKQFQYSFENFSNISEIGYFQIEINR